MPRRPVDQHVFWRDPALAHLEARAVADGRTVCYVPHSHPTFSIGAITGGHSDFVIRGERHLVTEGTVVLMNPDAVHACNPVENQPWSYRMLYVDVDWLGRVQGGNRFQPYGALLSTDAGLYADLIALFDRLFDGGIGRDAKDAAATRFFAALSARVDGSAPPAHDDHAALDRAARYIARHCTEDLPLDTLAAASGLSPSYLVRAFKARYGLTPHAYQTDRRIRFGREALRRGLPIVEVALEAGFADQAHFQRVFKAHVAATPGQFATSAASQQGDGTDRQQRRHDAVEQAHAAGPGQDQRHARAGEGP